MGEAARKTATYEDLLSIPPRHVGEILLGTLWSHPRPRSIHASATGALHAELAPRFRFGRGGPGGWMILEEPELHLAADVLVPDLAGWRRTRMPEMPDTPHVELAPDWVCEVLSPSTAKLDRTDKMTIYAREGVTHVWHVDPTALTLEIFRLEGPHDVRLGAYRDAARVKAEPFDTFELELEFLWAR